MGRFRSPGNPPIVYFTQPATFAPTQRSASGILNPNQATHTLALRVWMGPVKLSHQPFTGGLHYAPLLGEAGAIAAQAHLEWMGLIRNDATSPIYDCIFLFLAIVAASLVLFDRSDPVYLWVAGALLLMAIDEVFWTLAAWTQLVSIRTFSWISRSFSFRSCWARGQWCGGYGSNCATPTGSRRPLLP